jgi:hypothetical protein
MLKFAEIYQQMPEKGDSDQPELVILLTKPIWFLIASKTLLEQIETIKTSSLKGIGIYFVTQTLWMSLVVY